MNKKNQFMQVIENDKRYLHLLNDHAKNIDRKLSAKGLNAYECSKLKLEQFEIMGKIAVHSALVDDKLKHYKEVFLPSYEMKCKEVEKYFDSRFQAALELVQNPKNSGDLIAELQVVLNTFSSEQNKQVFMDDKIALLDRINRLVFLFKQQQS